MEKLTVEEIKPCIHDDKVLRGWYKKELAENFETDNDENLESFIAKYLNELLYVIQLTEAVNLIRAKTLDILSDQMRR